MISDFDKAMFWTLLAFKGLTVKDVACSVGIAPDRLSYLLSSATSTQARRDFLRARINLMGAEWKAGFGEDLPSNRAVTSALREYTAVQIQRDALELNKIVEAERAGSGKAVAA